MCILRATAITPELALGDRERIAGETRRAVIDLFSNDQRPLLGLISDKVTALANA